MYLMDQLFYLIDIQQDSTANKMLDEFSDIIWASLFGSTMRRHDARRAPRLVRDGRTMVSC